MLKLINLFNTNKFPPFLKLLFFVEMWERFSYYGMRSLLVLFLTSHLGFKDVKAYSIYSLFAAIGYAGPVLGGFIADRLMGFRNMVMLGGIIITIGHFFMALIELEPKLIYFGLALIAVGSGMFKGNIANLLGSCYKPNDSNRMRGFNLFYVSINLGSSIATISCSYIAYLYGWHYGFAAAGLGMFIGLIIFAKFKYILGDNGDSPRPSLMTKRMFSVIIISSVLIAIIVMKMLIYSEFFTNIIALSGAVVFSIFAYITFSSPKEQRQKLLALTILLIFFISFFALEMQLGSLINLFTERNVINTLFGVVVPASISQAINPTSIIIFGVLAGAYMKFDKKYATAIFAFGLLTMPICFVILYLGCLDANMDGKVAYLYLVAGLAFMSLGELCIGPLIQEQANLLAPKTLRGFVMGIVMLAAALSNLSGVIIAKFMSVPSINGEVNPLESLEIYKEGFWKIAMFNLSLALLFLFFYKFIYKTITNKT